LEDNTTMDLKEKSVRLRTEFNWFRTGSHGGLFGNCNKYFEDIS
jgi:hypothetical protein